MVLSVIIYLNFKHIPENLHPCNSMSVYLSIIFMKQPLDLRYLDMVDGVVDHPLLGNTVDPKLVLTLHFLNEETCKCQTRNVSIARGCP